jgi:prepilin-type processing-associated H-X9-DG protein
MPALFNVRQFAFQTICGTNLNSIGIAMNLYANENNGKFPTPAKWCDILSNDPKLGIIPKIFICKGAEQGPCDYAMNKNVENLGRNTPADMVLLFDSTPGWNQSGGPEILSTENHIGRGCNILFADGHVDWVKKEDLHKLRWTTDDSP